MLARAWFEYQYHEETTIALPAILDTRPRGCTVHMQHRMHMQSQSDACIQISRHGDLHIDKAMCKWQHKLYIYNKTVVYIHTTELLIASRLAYVLIGGVGSKFNQAPLLCWILMGTLSVDVWYRLKPLKHKTLSHQGSVMTGPQSGKVRTFKWPSKRLEGLRRWGLHQKVNITVKTFTFFSFFHFLLFDEKSKIITNWTKLYKYREIQNHFVNDLGQSRLILWTLWTLYTLSMANNRKSLGFFREHVKTQQKLTNKSKLVEGFSCILKYILTQLKLAFFEFFTWVCSRFCLSFEFLVMSFFKYS